MIQTLIEEFIFISHGMATLREHFPSCLQWKKESLWSPVLLKIAFKGVTWPSGWHTSFPTLLFFTWGTTNNNYSWNINHGENSNTMGVTLKHPPHHTRDSKKLYYRGKNGYTLTTLALPYTIIARYWGVFPEFMVPPVWKESHVDIQLSQHCWSLPGGSLFTLVQ